MKKKDNHPEAVPTRSSEDDYYFGKIEMVKFEELNLPQFELSVFASADLGGGFCDGNGGDNRTCPPVS